MENFFGISSGSSLFDKRRHINTIYAEFFEFRLQKEGQPFVMNKLVPILQKGKNERFNDIQNHILSDLEYSFLYYLKNRYNLSDDEFITIIAGENHFQRETKTPAGYSLEENYRLLVHMIYATLCVSEYYQSCSKQVLSGFVSSLARQFSGFNTSIGTIIALVNECLAKGLTNFTDLPKIENYVISKVM